MSMALRMPFEGERSFESIRNEDDLLALFSELFPDAVAKMPRLVEDYFSHPETEMVTVRSAIPSMRAGLKCSRPSKTKYS